ncbi:MAG: M24 family metallopeptidase, partial [Pirellulaceae bacterium]
METNKAKGTAREARLMAGIPAIHAGIYRRIRFSVGDPVAVVDLPKVDGANSEEAWETTLILRDIEMDRARRQARVDRVHCPRDFAPTDGLSGDRETATAQAAAECVRRSGCASVVVDRSLPAIYSEMMQRAGIAVRCDTEWGIVERRQKDQQEIAWIAEAQAVTESVMERACRTIAAAQADRDGYLLLDGSPLTSERMMRLITGWLLDAGYSNPGSIVAGGPVGADCHDHGHGPLRTGQPVIVDIYPKNQATLYNGDCTRTVVHGQIPDPVAAMHRAVVAAKKAAIATIRPGVTGEQVHRATLGALEACGYRSG